jgi:hypothetical protein
MGNTSDSTTGNSKEVSVDVGATTVFGQVASFDAVKMPLSNTTKNLDCDGYVSAAGGLTNTAGRFVAFIESSEPSDGVAASMVGSLLFYRKEGSNEMWCKCSYTDGTVKDGKIADLT